MTDKQEIICSKTSERSLSMEDRELQEFLERLGQEQKERERVAIQALILAKESRIAQTKLTSIESLKEISEGMYQQTSNGLPSTLKDALEGESAVAAEQYVKQMKQPTLVTPVKRG